MDLRHWLTTAVDEIGKWQAEFGSYAEHPASTVTDDQLAPAFGELVTRLRDNYPFGHPRYAGQMLKPPHPVAIAGYLAAMLINPNNHALDGGPATAQLERETVDTIAAMFGYPHHLGHLTTSGTIANLEALFVARELHPDKGIAHSADAHYTHARMCHVLGVPSHPIPTDPAGRMDLTALETQLRTGTIGTVVLTAGTTGLGAIDPIHDALALRERYGVRIHVDAAYGGFFRLIADDTPDGVASAPFAAIANCDSVVIDPHKHGLQPYGCGAVLFADPTVGRFYRHDSPYTYFTSTDLHLGEISLECSHAGASAAALWLTFQLLPPTPDGIGAILRPGRRAALRWANLLDDSTVLRTYQQPELDIVTYLPRSTRLSDIDRISAAMLTAGMTAPPDDAVFLATYGVTPAALAARGHHIDADIPTGRILRSVLMRPEQDNWLDYLHTRVEQLAAEASSPGN
jgi:glutamate/tyrosine decarboxylase-like PLP-dependent enzyme